MDAGTDRDDAKIPLHKERKWNNKGNTRSTVQVESLNCKSGNIYKLRGTQYK